jgi:short-subunit dehydrogenase
VIAVVHLTRAALPGMIARKRGWVMNLSSVAGFQAGPSMATYCSTKAFVTSFTESIAEELKGTGVSVTAVCPGFTSTEFQQVAGQGASLDKLPKLAIMTADQVAEAALKATLKGTVIAVPGLPNRMLVGLTSVLPRVVTRKVAGLTMKQLD